PTRAPSVGVTFRRRRSGVVRSFRAAPRPGPTRNLSAPQLGRRSTPREADMFPPSAETIRFPRAWRRHLPALSLLTLIGAAIVAGCTGVIGDAQEGGGRGPGQQGGASSGGSVSTGVPGLSSVARSLRRLSR